MNISELQENSLLGYGGLIYLRKEGPVPLMCTCVIDAGGKILLEEVVEYDRIYPELIYKTARELCSSFSGIRVICIGIPGIIRQGKVDLCELFQLQGVSLEERIREENGVDVIVENDVNAAVLGYYHHHKQCEKDSIAYIYYPSSGCAGTGLIINGELFQGHSGFAGEMAFLPLGIDPEEQGELQLDRMWFFYYMVSAVKVINTVLNPREICISLMGMKKQFFQKVVRAVHSSTPRGHEPTLTFIEDIHRDWINGLSYLALNHKSSSRESFKVG